MGIAEFLLVPVETSEFEEQHTFLHPVACGFLVAFLIGADGVDCVFVEQIDIAHGIVDLVEIVFVVVRGRHSLESADGLLRLSGGHHLGHGDACVEGEFIGRVLGNHFLVGLIGLLLVAESRFELSHKEPFTCALLPPHLMFDDFSQVGDGFLVFAGVNIVVGIGIVPFLGRMPVDGVAAHLTYHILCVIEPFLLEVAFGEPCAGLGIDGRLCLVEPAHIRESGSGLVKSPFVELRPSHEHPCFPHHGVVFAAVEPFDVFCRLSPALGPLGPFVDAVQFDGFLAFLNGSVEVAAPEALAVFVAYGIEWYDFGVVVLVAVLLLERTVDIGEGSVVIGVVFGSERLPKTALRRVLLRRARRTCQQKDCKHQADEDFGLSHLII